jgi:hypothetical protein
MEWEAAGVQVVTGGAFLKRIYRETEDHSSSKRGVFCGTLGE